MPRQNVNESCTGRAMHLSYLLTAPVFMFVLLLSRLLATYLERTGTSALKALLLLQFLFLGDFVGLCVSQGSELEPKSAVSTTAGMFVHLLLVILGFTLGCALGATTQSAYGSGLSYCRPVLPSLFC
jgi:hypothetical protein